MGSSYCSTAANNAAHGDSYSLSSAHNKKKNKKNTRRMMRTRTRSDSAQHKDGDQDDTRCAAAARGAAGDYFEGTAQQYPRGSDTGAPMENTSFCWSDTQGYEEKLEQKQQLNHKKEEQQELNWSTTNTTRNDNYSIITRDQCVLDHNHHIHCFSHHRPTAVDTQLGENNAIIANTISIGKTREQLSTLKPSFLPRKQDNHMKTRSFRSPLCKTNLLPTSRKDQKDSGVAHDSFLLLPSRTEEQTFSKSHDSSNFSFGKQAVRGQEKGVDNDAIIVSSATRMSRGRMQDELLLDDAVHCYPMSPLEKMHLFLDGLSDLIKHPGSSRAITFPLKLMYILECGDYSEFCRWNSDGKSFYIIDLVDFEKSVLGSIFKTEKFASFQRRLYRWNFFKSHANSSGKDGNSEEGQNNHTYKHHQFCKGNWNQVRNIQCRKRTLSKKELENREAKKRAHEERTIRRNGLAHGQEMLPQKNKADISSAACHDDDLKDSRRTTVENIPKKGRKHYKYKNEEQLLPLLANREDASSTIISSTSGSSNFGGGTAVVVSLRSSNKNKKGAVLISHDCVSTHGHEEEVSLVSFLKGLAQKKSDAFAKKLGSADVARRISCSSSSRNSSSSSSTIAGGADGDGKRNSSSMILLSQQDVTTHTSPGKTDSCRAPGVAPPMNQLVSCGDVLGADSNKAAEWTSWQNSQMEDEIRQLREQNMAIARAIVEDSQKVQTIVTTNKVNLFSQRSSGSGTNYSAAALQLSKNLVSHMPSTSLMQSTAVSAGGVVLPPAVIVMGSKDGIIHQSFHHPHSNITMPPWHHPHQSANNSVATFLPRQEYVSPFNTNPNGGGSMMTATAVNKNGQSNSFWQELHATSPSFFNNYHYY